jgi:DNA invertase Pin-like site-specific DNA recombinase
MPAEPLSKVTATHLRRDAYLYVRQSTIKQVLTNTESALRQYDLKSRAVALGWTAEQIIVIDVDQGHSGASTADREGFQRLVAEVGMGRAGIVLGLECSRLARNNADWHRLLEICGLTGTLICDEDGLYDPTDFNDRLVLGMKGQLSEAELHYLRSRLRGGMCYDPVSNVVLDPDRSVQQAITHLFATFDATGSAHAVVKAFRDAGLLFPRRHRKGTRKGELDWAPLTHSTVLRVLHNPRYAGVFSFGRTRQTLAPDHKPHPRPVTTRQDQIAFIPAAHPGYITLAAFDANQARLAECAAAHGSDRKAGPPREGPALLQGSIICGRCGRRMTLRYHTAHDRNELPTYVCQQDKVENNGPDCQTIPGAGIDTAIGQLLIDTLTPLAIDAAFTVTAELEHRAHEADQLRAAAVHRARYHADLARRRYLAVDPANRLVADTRSRLEHRPSRPARRPRRLRPRQEHRHRNAHRGAESPHPATGHRLPRHLQRPRHPAPRTQTHRPPAPHRRHRDQDRRHHHLPRPAHRRPRPDPDPAHAQTGLAAA